MRSDHHAPWSRTEHTRKILHRRRKERRMDSLFTGEVWGVAIMTVVVILVMIKGARDERRRK
jgi:hypothetical protein